MRTRSTAADLRLHPPTRRRGFTLVELVASMAIGSLLLGGMGSAMLIASHALPGRNTATDAILRASDMVEQMAGELHCAVTFTQRSATMVEIKVPDRNGDLAPETILYAWSGTPGDPLTRQYNAGTVVNVAEHAQQFDLSYVLQASTSSPPAPDPVEMPEELFLMQDNSNSGSESEFALSGNDACAEKFKPGLPADAVSWRITRIRFMASPVGGTKSSLKVSLMTVNQATGNPKEVMDVVVVPESSLVANNWYEVQFTNAGGLSPSDPYFIVIRKWSGGGTAGLIKIGTGSLNSPGTTYWENTSGWLEDPTTDLWLWVWGTASVPDPNPPPSSQGSLVSVGIKLRLGMDARTRVQTAAQVLNAPDVTGP